MTASSSTNGQSEPWYRHRWPWVLIAGPAIVVVASFASAWLAIASDDGVVADDYYKRGLAINKVLAREERGEALHLGAVVAIGADGVARVDLAGDAGALATATVRLTLTHPTRAGRDVAVTLERMTDGSYEGRVGELASGRWLVGIDTDTWRLPSVESTAPGSIRLGSARLAR